MAGSIRNESKFSLKRDSLRGKATDSGFLDASPGPESNSELLDIVDLGSEGRCVRYLP